MQKADEKTHKLLATLIKKIEDSQQANTQQPQQTTSFEDLFEDEIPAEYLGFWINCFGGISKPGKPIHTGNQNIFCAAVPDLIGNIRYRKLYRIIE